MADTKQPRRRRHTQPKPTTTNPHITEKQGLPVYTGPVRGDLTRALEEDREERSRAIWGAEGGPASSR